MASKRCALAVAAAILAAAACGEGGKPEAGDGAVVARVGGRPITKSYYEQRLQKMERRFLPDTLDLAGKREFLEYIVHKELMALKAEELGYQNDPHIVRSLGLMEDNLILNTAVDEITKGKLDVSEQDILDFEEKKKEKVLVKHILVATRATAGALRQELSQGADFDTLVARHSIVPRQDANTGEPLPHVQRAVFGDVQFGDAIIPVEEVVFSTPIGAVSQPVWTAYGWHLFMPISRETVNRAPLDADGRRRNEVQIQLRRKRTLVEAYYEGILKQHGFRMDEEALAAVYDKLPLDVGPEQAPDAAKELKPVLPLSHEERSRFFFEVDGKAHTLGDFSDRYDATSWFERPKRVTGAIGIRYWIRDRWLRPLQLQYARDKGVHLLPPVADEIRLRREQMMVNMLHENLVGGEAPDPTQEQLQQFYAEHKTLYVDKERRQCNVIFNAQERVVRRAYDEILGGKDFVEVAIRYNEGATSPEHVRTPLFTADAPEFVEIAPKAFALEPGRHTEPFKTKDFWVLLQLVQVTPDRQMPLEDVMESVTADWQNTWRDNRLNELLAEWKSSVKVEVDDAILAAAEVRRTDVVVPEGGSPP